MITHGDAFGLLYVLSLYLKVRQSLKMYFIQIHPLYIYTRHQEVLLEVGLLIRKICFPADRPVCSG